MKHSSENTFIQSSNSPSQLQKNVLRIIYNILLLSYTLHRNVVSERSTAKKEKYALVITCTK